jgi:hypothetical protein
VRAVARAKSAISAADRMPWPRDSVRCKPLMVNTFLKVYGAWFLFLFLQEQIKDIIIRLFRGPSTNDIKK